MKAILLLISFCFLSCASRKTNTSIKTEENRSKIEQNYSAESNIKIDRKDLEIEKKEVSKFNLLIKNNSNSGTSTTQNNCPKTGNIIYKDKDGNEATIPVNENSEINLNSESDVETKLKQTELELAAKIIQNNNLITENESLKKEKSKETERDGLTFWGLILVISGSVIGGIICWEILKKWIPSLLIKFKK
ncbi:hypothetical protein [Chryseobacterium sp.]|uniref:hypothetical protein n=1 Tax=Chryseobacterium sp. TaxID=1871047 RepID=UPI0012D08C94|nr:hypothetical protein [Chryseobacterium sp.]MPS66832.1 hypothetical protein [Chryseobacterium sp.]